MSGLRILSVSTSDGGGGAERVARDLHEHYVSAGHDAWLAVGRIRTGGERTREIPNDAWRPPWARAWNGLASALPSRWGGQRIANALRTLGEPGRRRSIARGEEDFDFPGTRAAFQTGGGAPAVVHLHNLHGAYFDLRALPEWSARVPVVASLHDSWLFAGHCAHPLGCAGWESGCGSCPALWIYPAVPRDATAFNFARKREIFARSSLHLGVPCEWLARRARESMLAPAIRSVRVIPYGVDLGIYRPAADRDALCRSLGLDPRRAVFMLFASALQHRTWKDAGAMHRALALVGAAADAQWISIGAVGPDLTVGRARIRQVAAEPRDADLARWYQAADAYVHPARADTFPLVNLEAQACGAAVVSSGVDGIPEQVVTAPPSAVAAGTFATDATGIIARAGHAPSLAAALDAIAAASPESRRRLGAQAAAWAKRRFDRAIYVREYESWLRELAAQAAN